MGLLGWWGGFVDIGNLSYFVNLVVVLRVVFKHLWLLGVLKGMHEVVGTEFFSPFLICDEPGI